MVEVAARGTLFVLSAPSGAGKTTLARAVIGRLARRGVSLEFSVSYTTRQARAGETDGHDYHFVSTERFGELVAQQAFLEHAEVFGRHYGTGREVTEVALGRGRNLILDIDWQGARQVRDALPADSVSIFVLPPSRAVLQARLAGRGQDSDEVIAQRMAQAAREIARHDEYDYLVVNDDLERATDELEAICLARCLRGAQQRQRHAALIRELLAEPGASR